MAGLVTRGIKHGPAPNQVSNAVRPGPERPQQHKPENDCEQAIVGMDTDSCFDFANTLQRICRKFPFSQRFGGLANLFFILSLQRCAIVVDAFADILRAQREKQNNDGKDQIGKSQ